MTGWTRHSGLAVVLDRENIDTDQLIPARFMSTPRSAGYGGFLLHDLRHDSDGHPLPDFPLNAEPGASVLVSRRNFGSGSSREAAVYALVDFGIRAVIAPSFGDIFSGNAVNNGLLPARISEAETDALIAHLRGTVREIRIDLTTRSIAAGEAVVRFDLADAWQHKLMNGWDDIDLTRQHEAAISGFRDRHAKRIPGAVPVQRTNSRSAGRVTGSQ